MHKSLTHTTSLVTLLVMLLILSGCASKESIKLVSQYAEQAVAVQQGTLAAYDEAENARQNAKLMQAVRDGSTINHLIPDTFSAQGQKEVLENLLAFSQAVHRIASEDRGEALDKESDKLNSALISLSEESGLEQVSEKDITAFSTAINALARAYTEKARFDALKTVMRESQGIVNVSIAALRRDMPAWKQATRVSLQTDLNIRMELLNNPRRCGEMPARTCVEFSQSMQEQMEAYRKASQIKGQIDHLDEQFDTLDGALASLLDLNRAVITSLESDDDRTLAAAKKAVRATREQVKAVRKFQKGIKE